MNSFLGNLKRKIFLFSCLALVFTLMCPRVADAADVYCRWSENGCTYVVVVPDGGGEGDIGAAFICGDGWILYGTGIAGTCPY